MSKPILVMVAADVALTEAELAAFRERYIEVELSAAERGREVIVTCDCEVRQQMPDGSFKTIKD